VKLEPVFHSGKVKWHEQLIFADEQTEVQVKTGYANEAIASVNRRWSPDD
jgi:hypothetical protein